MTANKHTPGPWFASGRYIGTFNHKSAIGECRSASGCWSDDEPASANARLIAAAPELLEELIYAREWITEVSDRKGIPAGVTLARIGNAISKATGGAQ